MPMKYDDTDLQPSDSGEYTLVAVFRDEQGRKLPLDHEQLERLLAADLDEVHEAGLTKGELQIGRTAVMECGGMAPVQRV